MQTLFDQTLMDFIVAGLICKTVVSITNLGWGPLENNHYLGLTYIYANIFFSTLFFYEIIVTLLTRYMLIFHSVLMSNVIDHWFQNVLRSLGLLLSILTTIGEDLTSEFDRSKTFTKLTGIQHKEGIKNLDLSFIKTWICLVMIVVIFVMLRIELLKSNYCKSEKLNTHKSADMGYSQNTLRVMLVIFLTICVLNVLYVCDILIDDPYLNRIIFHTILTFCIFVVLPTLMVVRNDNLFHFFRARFSLCLKCSSRVSPL